MLVLTSVNWHKGSNAISVVDYERMSPGHWLGSLRCVPFSVLTLLVQ